VGQILIERESQLIPWQALLVEGSKISIFARYRANLTILLLQFGIRLPESRAKVRRKKRSH
jgi:hypothetical protein